MNKITALVKNPLMQRVVTYALSDGLSKLIPFLFFPLVAIYLNAEEFGIVANFSVLTQVLLALILVNSHTFLSVEYHKVDETNRKEMIRNISLAPLLHGALMGLVIFLLSSYLEKYTYVSPFWQMMAVFWTVAMAYIYIYQSVLRMEEKARGFARLQIIQALLSASLTLLLVIILQYGLVGRLSSLVLSVGGIGIYCAYRLGIGSFSKGAWKKVWMLQIYAFGLPLLPHTLSFWIKSGVDKIYVTNYMAIADTGVYAFAETLTVIFSMAVTSFFSAYTPHLYKELAEMDKSEDLQLKNERKAKLVDQAKFFLFGYVLVLFLSYFLISWLIGKYYMAEYGGSLQYFHYMVIGAFFPAIYSTFSLYLFYLKKTKLLGTITFLSSLLHTGLNFFIIQYFQVTGIVVTNLFIGLLMAAVVAYHANKNYPMPWRRLIFIPIFKR